MDLKTVEKLLTTTRSVRKRLDLDRAVEPAVIQKCLDWAIQAPTGSNSQGWAFMVIADAEKRAQIGDYYRQSFDTYLENGGVMRGKTPRNDAEARQNQRAQDSATYLSEVMGRVPVLILALVKGRPENPSPFAQAGHYGSILPAAWSLMLALRAHGLGASWTTLHLRYEREIAEILGIPDNMTQAALLPVAYFTGEDFHPARRRPAEDITYWDTWGNTLERGPEVG